MTLRMRASILFILAGSVQLTAAGPTFITFDGTSGGVYTLPTAINDSGTVAGYFSDPTGYSRAFIRTPDGTILTFDAPGAGTGSNQGTYAAAITVVPRR